MAEEQELITSSMELESAKKEAKKSLFFKDGVRKIDYVLVYEDNAEEDADEREQKKVKREAYLHNLRLKHLELEEIATPKGHKDEYGSTETDKGDVTHYIKIHGPFDILCDTAEDIKMKMPIKANDIDIKTWSEKKFANAHKWFSDHDPFVVRDRTTKDEPHFFVAHFDKERMSDFIGHDNEQTFFSPAERSRLVYYTCEQTRYGSGDLDVGIDHLVHSGVFSSQYPLHDGPLNDLSEEPENDRQRLHRDWARLGRIFKYQPVSAIKEYFGEKVALYFAWLGFYTSLLGPAAVVGILCFLYGVLSVFNYIPVKEMCNKGGQNSSTTFYMCPLCDQLCSYYLLSSACMYAKVTHFFDNQATLFFALFMSFWAVFFLEFWKRKQITLAHEWHTMDFEEEEERPRPEYLAKVTTLKKNPVTGLMEPYLAATQRIPRLAGAGGVVIFFILLVIGGITSVVVYRAVIYAILLGTGNAQLRTRAKIIVAMTAACINLVVINLLKFVYQKIALILTNWETPRTQTDYEDSFTIKMFWFQFVNTYASVFYVAFFKNEYFNGWPGHYNRRRMGGTAFRFEGCSAQGCFLELCVQLIIIMVGQQCIGNIIEVVIPWLKNKLRTRSSGVKYAVAGAQWEVDCQLEPQDELSLFWQYLEIVLQYGFVTMFVAAFPLAPFFAWLNNIFEIRLDANNFIRAFRRPVAQRAEDIGAWYYILDTLTTLSVLVNAFVLAFTSELIPKLVYVYRYSPTGDLAGYVDFSLSKFNVTKFDPKERPDVANATVPYLKPFCRYPGFHDVSGGYSKVYWQILAIRLSFIFVFQWFITFVARSIAWAVPDIPSTLALTIKREHYLAAQSLQEHKEKCGKRKARPKGFSQANGATPHDHHEHAHINEVPV